MYAHRARSLEASDPEVDSFVVEALFTTVTNVNFDEERMEQMIRRAENMRDRARKLYEMQPKHGLTPETLSGRLSLNLQRTEPV